MKARIYVLACTLTVVVMVAGITLIRKGGTT
jgi:hypothetical protein